MKKIVFLLSVLIFFVVGSYAHTCYPDTVYCPVDSQKVIFCVTKSMNVFGSYYDFAKKGAIGSYYEEMINGCPKCHFSGYQKDFETTYNAAQKASIRVLLAAFQNTTLTDAIECTIAADIHILLADKNGDIADIYIVGSYLLRGSIYVDQRKKMQELSCSYFQKAIATDEYKKGEIATIYYLIGELYRRTGHFDKAANFFNQAVADINKQDWIEKIVSEQKKLLEKKDDNNDI